MPQLPVFVVARQGEAWVRALEEQGLDAAVVSSLDSFEPSGLASEGLLLLDRAAVSADDALAVAGRVKGPGWCVALVERGEEDHWRVETLSLGSSDTLEDAAAFARDPQAHPGALLELRRALRDAGRLRHDVNNILAAGLAETELLLMDLDEGETRDAVDVIRQQMLRIRDQMLATSHLRAPRG